MAIYELGLAIKERREQLGLSQEALAYGICAVSTLSRIENGVYHPKNGYIERLLERLGDSAMQQDIFSSREQVLIHEGKILVRQSAMEMDYPAARQHFHALKAHLHKPNKFDKQFLLMYEVILNRQTLSPEQELAMLEEAMLLTCPKYKAKGIPKLLSYDEIIVLNNIAICYGRMGEHGKAVETLSAIRDFYNRQAVYREEALRTQPMILYNLSKHLGQLGRYDECIAVCDEGILIARKSGRCSCIVGTLYNRAWAMLRRDRPGDRELAELSLRQAYALSFGLENDTERNALIKFYEKNFQKGISV